MIAGSAERHVQSGSTISLLCIIQGSLEAPQFILWYHNNQMVNYDQSRGGTTVTMDHQDPTTSRLTITTATTKDTGNYTCSAANTVPASINVFVSQGKGDKTAAIQRLGSGSWGLMGSGWGGSGFSLCLFVVCWQAVVVLAVLLGVPT
ncbi:hypothetical protein Pcinc_033497 [Petrolisthes cinctipes]|uniref:Ig-like domain-containing protein n=1 Tax=Petrolisthes cinctipes TaxID=88211 RepID=A0AAE1JZ64_PETCI|nr:hypothetical protein Pcinc_033497 [Petrolisthes cinctipes]